MLPFTPNSTVSWEPLERLWCPHYMQQGWHWQCGEGEEVFNAFLNRKEGEINTEGKGRVAPGQILPIRVIISKGWKLVLMWFPHPCWVNGLQSEEGKLCRG